jgi:acylphosphatase
LKLETLNPKLIPVIVARKFVISGEVQGVGYRFFAQRAAARHQVRGYVRNLADGRVEALAEGPAPAVDEFKHDLAAGPSYSRVEHLEETVLEPSGQYPTFRIER